MNIPKELKYTQDHEWVKIEDHIATIGITDFAQSELGDIVYVDVPTLDGSILAEDVLGSIEAVKTVSEIFSPLSGKVIEQNVSLETSPESINKDPYDKGWILKMELSDKLEIDKLLTADQYRELIGG